MAARTLGLILAIWEFFTAFAWPRTHAGFMNAWIVGLLAAVSTFAGMSAARARFAATALSAWLLVAALFLPRRSPLAHWNDVLVALAMLALSLVPGTMYRTAPQRA